MTAGPSRRRSIGSRPNGNHLEAMRSRTAGLAPAGLFGAANRRGSMLAVALLLFLPWPGEPVAKQPEDGGPTLVASDDAASMRGDLMAKVDEMRRSGSGIFNEDVTAIVAPLFTSGESLKDVAEAVRANGLGELEAFKGKTASEDGTMFVSRGDLMEHALAQVFVVADFAFRKSADGTLVLDHVRAFLRSRSM